MLNMDVFRSDAFSMQELTLAVTEAPYVPRKVGDLGIFNYEGVTTTAVMIEKIRNTLVLVKTTPRGGPAIQNTKDPRNLITIPTSRIAMEDSITADEVQNVREFGTNQLVSLQSEVNKRNVRQSNNIEATMEYHRVGALKGKVMDADGSTLIDAFELFDVDPQDPVDFELDAGSPADGALRQKCSDVIRLIEEELGADGHLGIYGMCSSQFFDKLVAHKEYRAAYLNTERGEGKLIGRMVRRQIDFGGITFEEYRGTVGGTAYVEDGDAHFFPIGVSGLFEGRFAPAEWWDTVNTVGLPRYARIFFDPKYPDSQVSAHVQTQPLHICTRPRVLIPATMT